MARVTEQPDLLVAEATPLRDHYGAECRPSRVEYLGSAGGFSGARFWRLETPRGALCLRRWPAEYPDRERLTFIHAVLEHVHRNGFTTIPLPIRNRDGKTFVSFSGHLWELTPWLPGAADFLPEQKPEKLAAAMTALARWHLAAADFPQSDRQPAASPGILSRLSQLDQLCTDGLAHLSIAVEIAPSKRPEWAELARLAVRLFALFFRVEPIVRPKLSSAAFIPVPWQPCIRDIWHDHVLFVGDRVSGIIDFGALRFETVAGDVARLLDSIAGDDPQAWERGMADYQAVRRLSDDELALARAFDESAMLLSGFNWLDWVFISQRSFDNPDEIVRRVKAIAKRLEIIASTAGV